MSTTPAKKHSDLKAIGVTLFILLLIVVAMFAVGCSTSEASTPDPEASAAAAPAEDSVDEPAPEAEVTGVHAFGETVTFDDGLSLSVSTPSEFTPSELSAGAVDGQSSVVFEFVISNNTDKNFDPVLMLATASSGGSEASGVFDTDQGVGFPPTTVVLPGQTIKWLQAFSVADPASITLETSVSFSHDDVIFTNNK